VCSVKYSIRLAATRRGALYETVLYDDFINRPLAFSPGTCAGRFRGSYTVAKSKGKKSDQDPNQRSIAQNRKAHHNFLVIDTLECGIVLVGSEVKSLRKGHVSLEEAYARVKDNEVWMVGCDIPEYVEANQFNHQPKRPRKLLIHRREIKRFAALAFQKGLTLVPLKMYFNEGRAKVLLGLCKGKQKHDKREAMKNAEVRRDIQRQMYRRR
jgi:SsrA-binding protein